MVTLDKPSRLNGALWFIIGLAAAVALALLLKWYLVLYGSSSPTRLNKTFAIITAAPLAIAIAGICKMVTGRTVREMGTWWSRLHWGWQIVLGTVLGLILLTLILPVFGYAFVQLFYWLNLQYTLV